MYYNLLAKGGEIVLTLEESKYLIKSSESILNDIQKAYTEYINLNDIPFELKDKIKEFLSKIYSALEYQAFNIFNLYCKDKINPEKLERAESKIYFPNKDYEPAFNRFIVDRFPSLMEARPDLIALIKSIQPFPGKQEQWLRDLNKLNNANKHRNLSKQKKQRAVLIKSGKIGTVTFKDTLIVSEGPPIVINDTSIDFETTTKYDSNFDVKVDIQFIFNEIDKPVLDTLKTIYEGANNFINRLEKML